DQAFHGRVLEALRADLMGHTDEGFVYRLDFRLRPYGRAGTLAVSTRALQRYYASAAALWEVQALLKARPIAGSRALGDGLLAELRPILRRPRDGARIAASVRHLRDRAGRHRAEAAGTDIKNGPGGIRDVEFLVQALQLAHAHREPGVLAAGTGEAIEALVAGGQLGPEHGRRLQDNYAFLRRVEHFLQLLDDRQTHTLPGRDADRDALARRVLGPRHHGADLMAAVHEVTGSTAELFASGLHDLEKP
ncbi:MAG: glutamine-synthetase adenylyltransferase, partial [Lentisphaerae bacterium]|nr:glutamine-synthetase adenylyltransferase [Lentisphaerota bacterium]